MSSHADNDDALQATVGLLAPDVADPRDGGTLAGQRVGPYRLISLLGRGGMGEVYVAAQDEPVRRTVALKLLRSDHLDTRRLSHFEVERQLLAQMRHPAIAQIFDAGTTADGHPYSAMELIDGLPVTGYCAREGLPLRARLELFVRICEGVQHAHQKGVVHRDLKPGNILVARVDGRALPKIIDFGIASITSGGSSDGGSDVLGTPAYMSPEQAAAPDEVDTRSDIYSLGVLLHELLCGHRPQQNGQHAFRPSTRLARELGWVVGRATAPDRIQRYASVTELAEDLRRFLDGQPLAAVPDSRGYRWGKFVRRNRGGLAVAGMILLALLGGLGMSLYGLDQARTQQALAEERARQLEAVSGFQQAMLERIDIESTGLALAASLRAQIARTAPDETEMLERVLVHAGPADIARELIGGSILARAEEAIGRDFGDQPALAADLRESVARVRRALGMHAEAAVGFGEVADARMQLLGGRATPTLRARREQISELLLGGREQLQVALDLLDQVRGDYEALAEDDPLRISFQFDETIARTSGDHQARRAGLEALLQRSRERLGERDPATLEVANSFAIHLVRLGELKAAGELLEQLVPMHTEVLGDLHPATRGAKRNLAIVWIRSNDHENAIALQRELVADDVHRLGAEHPTAMAARGNLANMLMDSGRSEEALPLSLAVFEARARVLGPEHPETLRSKLNASSVLAKLKHYDQALQMQVEVIEARTRLLGATHPDTLFMLINRPATLHQAGRTAESLEMMAQVLPVVRETLGERHPTTQMAMDIRAMVARESGDRPLAIETLKTLLGWRLAAQGESDWETVQTAHGLVEVLRDAGNGAEADDVWARHVQPLLELPPGTLSPGQRRLVDRIRGNKQAV